MDFALDAPGWDPGAIDALRATLKEYTDMFSSSKLDYGACSLRPFEIKVPPGTHPIQSRPYRLNPVLSKQVSRFLSRRRTHPTLHLSMVQPLVWIRKTRWHPNHGQLSKAEYGHRNTTDSDPPRRRGPRYPRRRTSFIGIRPLLGIYTANHTPGHYPFDRLLYTKRTLRMVTHASRRCRLPGLVCIRHASRYGWPGQHIDVSRRYYRIGRLPHGTRGDVSHLFCSVTTSKLEIIPEKITDWRSARRLSGTRHLSRRCTPQRRQNCRTSSHGRAMRHQTTSNLTGRPQPLPNVLPNIAKRVRSITSLLKKEPCST